MRDRPSPGDFAFGLRRVARTDLADSPGKERDNVRRIWLELVVLDRDCSGLELRKERTAAEPSNLAISVV
jgi:hypothetical protein